MEEPSVELVAELIKILDAGQREDFEERAGIIEFGSNVPRVYAERLALLDVLRRHPSVLDGHEVMKRWCELTGATNLSN